MTAVVSVTNVRVVVDCTPNCKKRSTKLKISYSCYWSVSLAYQVFIFCQKASFCCIFYLHPFNTMFIFSGKSCCCNGFTNVLFTLLLTIFNKKTNCFQMSRFSIPTLYCLKFSFKSANISKSYGGCKILQQFLSRVSILTCDTDIANLTVCP